MALIQGGPPEWIWERTPDTLKWELVPRQAPEGHTVYELRVSCGLEIMRLHHFTEDEMRELQHQIRDRLNMRAHVVQGEGGQERGTEDERVRPAREPGVVPKREPGNRPETPEAERPPQRETGCHKTLRPVC